MEENAQEGKIIKEILLEGIKEQRRKRRWGIFFKLCFLAIVLASVWYGFVIGGGKAPVAPTSPHTAYIRVEGLIASSEQASAENINTAMRRAASNKFSRGVILKILTPGGSPVQARLVFDEIIRLKEEHPNKPIIAVIEDMGASAGYLIASAADEIYANEASMVGSIGVLYNGFGFVDLLQKIGVERRIQTAGKYKAFMDPFSPTNEENEQLIQQRMDEIHKLFIENVKYGRGDRLSDNPDLFTGLFWMGEDALKLGLIDGFADIRTVAKEIIKAEKMVDYTEKTSFLDKVGIASTKLLTAFKFYLS